MTGVLQSHLGFDTVHKELLFLSELNRIFEIRLWAVGSDELLLGDFGFGRYSVYLFFE